jgi:hypothetical protein
MKRPPRRTLAAPSRPSEAISKHQGNMAKLNPRRVAVAYDRVRAISLARTIGLRKTGPGQRSVRQVPLAFTKCPPGVIKAHSGHKSFAVLLGYIPRAQPWVVKGATAGLL